MADQTTDQTTPPNEPTQNDQPVPYITEDCAKAPLNGRWVFKLMVITLVVLLVGAWGYWDATSVYPKRGHRYADWAKYQYLDQAKKADAEDYGIFIREASITDPKTELDRLSKTEMRSKDHADALNPSSPRTLRASMHLARTSWLEALKVVGMLDPEHTTIESPQRELETLKEKWQAALSQPKPLHAFDLYVQWIIMTFCWTIGLIMIVHMLKVKGKKYAWTADSMTLTLPDGNSITPDDLEEVDKRKWDKFIVFLKIKGAHDTLGGKEISVDTYQHQFVEDWILAMEEKAFGSQEDDDADADSNTDSGSTSNS